MKGKLYIIATPIGNMEDITLRAIRVLGNCDYILVESSERSSKVLQRHGITNKLVTFNKDNEKNKVLKKFSNLENGKVNYPKVSTDCLNHELNSYGIDADINYHNSSDYIDIKASFADIQMKSC